MYCYACHKPIAKIDTIFHETVFKKDDNDKSDWLIEAGERVYHIGCMPGYATSDVQPKIVLDKI